MSHIELADAQLARAVCDGTRVLLDLATAPARQPADGPGSPPVDGHLSGVTLVFEAATLVLDAGCAPGDCIGAVREGRLWLDGQALYPLPLPGEWRGSLSLALALRNGAGLQVRAQALQLRQAPDSRFTASLAC